MGLLLQLLTYKDFTIHQPSITRMLVNYFSFSWNFLIPYENRFRNVMYGVQPEVRKIQWENLLVFMSENVVSILRNTW